MTKLASITLFSLIVAGCGAADPNDLIGGSPRYTHPMPGEGPVTPPDQSTLAGDAGSSGSSGSSGADGGSSGAPDAAPAANAFTGAAAYAAQNGPNTIKGDHPNGGDPAKADCMTGACHGAGGQGPRFLAGGSVFKDVAGTMPAPQVEVRFLDGDGTTLSAYTDANGNFFVRANGAAANLAFPMKTGARDGTTTRPMSSSIANGACNSAACHGGAATGVIHVP
jgi:hypothetical protein